MGGGAASGDAQHGSNVFASENCFGAFRHIHIEGHAYHTYTHRWAQTLFPVLRQPVWPVNYASPPKITKISPSGKRQQLTD